MYLIFSNVAVTKIVIVKLYIVHSTMYCYIYIHVVYTMCMYSCLYITFSRLRMDGCIILKESIYSLNAA